jgi:hypothetical protein
MNVTMNLHGVTNVAAREAAAEGSRWVTLSFKNKDERSVLELTVFSDDPQALLAPLASPQSMDAVQAAAYAEGRKDEREEWEAVLSAAKCAENLLFLLSKELDAMGNKAPNVRQMLSNAIARVESEEAEAYATRRDERSPQEATAGPVVQVRARSRNESDCAVQPHSRPAAEAAPHAHRQGEEPCLICTACIDSAATSAAWAACVLSARRSIGGCCELLRYLRDVRALRQERMPADHDARAALSPVPSWRCLDRLCHCLRTAMGWRLCVAVMNDGPDYRQAEEAEMREFLEEQDAKREMRALEVAQEMKQSRDEAFIEALEAKFPTLLGWPGKKEKQ